MARTCRGTMGGLPPVLIERPEGCQRLADESVLHLAASLGRHREADRLHLQPRLQLSDQLAHLTHAGRFDDELLGAAPAADLRLVMHREGAVAAAPDHDVGGGAGGFEGPAHGAVDAVGHLGRVLVLFRHAEDEGDAIVLHLAGALDLEGDAVHGLGLLAEGDAGSRNGGQSDRRDAQLRRDPRAHHTAPRVLGRPVYPAAHG
jgi:hypothetical protein